MDEVIEGYRREAVRRVFATPKFKQCWPIWRNEISNQTFGFSDAESIYELGGSLRDIFALTAKKDTDESTGSSRGQSELSGGGAAWEGLVCWYLNAVLTGTRGVVVKHSKAIIPPALLDAISINYQNKPTNSESDLIGIVFPANIGTHLETYQQKEVNMFISENIGKTEVHVIQCKTNWNDNAQIPMLWDLVYKSRGFEENNLSIGQNGRDFGDLAAFSYSFVTVPTQKSEFKAGSMAVRRVSSLSGGNYWGRPSEPGVAWSISEMFKRVFSRAGLGDVRGHISSLVQNGLTLEN